MKRCKTLVTVSLLLMVYLGFHSRTSSSVTGSDFVLVDYLKFDEGTDIFAFDSSGYGNDGTLMPLTNGPNWEIPGRFGNAVRFDGNNDYVNVSDSNSLDITGNIRIEAWIKPDANNALMNIVTKWAQGNYSYTLNMGVLQNPSYPEHGNPGTHPGKIGFLWAPDGSSATRQYLVSNSVVSTGQWTNATVMYNGSSVRMYLNGNLDNSTAYTGSLFAGSSDLYIGSAADSSSFYFDGVIDEVKISRTYPTYDATIKAHCNINGVDVSVSIAKDGAFTGFYTPHTFTEFNTHTFTVPSVDAHGHQFFRWSTGLTSTTITVSSAGTYTAYYGALVLENHDVAVTSVTSSRAQAYQGYTVVNVYVQVKNEGTVPEDFSVTAYYNSTAIGTQTVTNLDSNASTMLTFIWNTAGVPFSNYSVSAEATPVLDEFDLADNSLTDGTVKVTIPGDVNGDRTVNILDISVISSHWSPGPPAGPLGYDQTTDVNNDGAIDILDISVVSAYWGQSW